MANWCETYLTFQSNGSEAGNQALADFHNKLSCIASNAKCIDLEGHWINTLWEQDVEDYIMSKIDSLKGKSINANKRGYIGYMTDINNHTFHVVCYDAWVPNVDFWYILTTALYPQGLIEILYQATEPGCDVFLTNDRGLLPKYHMNVSIEGVTNLLNFPGMFNQQLSYGPLCIWLVKTIFRFIRIISVTTLTKRYFVNSTILNIVKILKGMKMRS